MNPQHILTTSLPPCCSCSPDYFFSRLLIGLGRGRRRRLNEPCQVIARTEPVHDTLSSVRPFPSIAHDLMLSSSSFAYLMQTTAAMKTSFLTSRTRMATGPLPTATHASPSLAHYPLLLLVLALRLVLRLALRLGLALEQELRVAALQIRSKRTAL